MPKFRLGTTEQELKEKVEKGEWQLHKYPLGFVLTEIRQYPEEKICIVHFLGGEQFDSWKTQVDDDLEKFAKAQGCKALEAGCRLGLERKMKSLGWKRWHVVIRKEL